MMPNIYGSPHCQYLLLPLNVATKNDKFHDNGDWNDADQENLPPRSTKYKDSDAIVQRTPALTHPPATATNEARKESISFGSDSFGKQEDLEKVLKEQEQDCHERNHLRPRLDTTHESRVRSWESSPASLNITRVSEESPPPCLNITRISEQTYSEIFTSTPIAGRVLPPFNPQVSPILDVVMDNSSIEIARNFVLTTNYNYIQSKNGKVLPSNDRVEIAKNLGITINPVSDVIPFASASEIAQCSKVAVAKADPELQKEMDECMKKS
uniref:Uncharacterized protein n=1 Tax=Panagrolaimus davidi TaxID=227884 RepID=A0A914P3C3_9BILA